MLICDSCKKPNDGSGTTAHRRVTAETIGAYSPSMSVENTIVREVDLCNACWKRFQTALTLCIQQPHQP